MKIKAFRCIAPNVICVERIKKLVKERLGVKTIFPDRCNDVAFFIYCYDGMLSYDIQDSFTAYSNHIEEELTYDQAVMRLRSIPVLRPIPKFEFKPFDKILRQSKVKEKWQIGLFSHIGKDGFVGINNAKIVKMVPYLGHENLLNTTQMSDDGHWEFDEEEDCPIFVRS